MNPSLTADVICPGERGVKRVLNLLSRCFSLSGFATLAAGGIFLELNRYERVNVALRQNTDTIFIF
jgi:hypothetical protein